MGHTLIKQPNGNYALFSSVADHFLWYDTPENEARELLLEDFRKDAEKKVESILGAARDDCPHYTVGIKGDGRSRWNDDAWHALIVHGPEDKDLMAVLDASGMAQDEIDKWVEMAIRARKELDESGGTSIHP